MEGADRFMMGRTGSNDFTAAGPACHEMRFDQSGNNAQVSVDESTINLDRRATRPCETQIDMVVVVASKVVFHLDRFENPPIAYQFFQLRPFIGAMQTSGDYHGD